MNINTKEYWNTRFASGDWGSKGGRKQTTRYAKRHLGFLEIPKNFKGSILDYGCALGDSIPVYSSFFKDAKLFGSDISEEAIRICRERHGNIAAFIEGTYESIPYVDIAVSSHVFEHISDDTKIVEQLLLKCKELYVIVPYKEKLIPNGEHINSYDENYFKSIGHYDYKIFHTYEGLSKWIDIHMKNLLRPVFGKKKIKNSKCILYHFKSRPS